MVEPPVHLPDHRGRRALLRTVDCAGSLFAAERIGHITRDAEGAFRQLGQHLILRDFYQLLQSLCSERRLISALVEHPISQSLQHADAAVIGCTSADAYDEAAAAVRNGIFDDLAYAVCGGVHGVALLIADKHDSGSSRHLHDGRSGLLQYAIGTVHGLAQRTGDCDRFQPAAHTQRKRLNRALAAIRQRTDDDFCRGNGQMYPPPNGSSGLQRAQTVLQRIHCDNNFHDALSFPFHAGIAIPR